MARIQLRFCEIYIQDGLSGTGAINQAMTVPMAGDTTMTVDTLVLNTFHTASVPIGANFTVAGETASTTVHTVTSVTTAMDVTTIINFTPALTTGTYADNGVITFSPQKLTVKIGDGELKYTINTAYLYDLDRGLLDTVRKGDDVPVDVSLAFTYEHITTGTGEPISPIDAVYNVNGAAGWVTSASDQCEPYAVDLIIVYTPPCGGSQIETTTFPDFRVEKAEPDFKNASITISGKAHSLEPIFTRTNQS